jgi:YD repeat-containing protein
VRRWRGRGPWGPADGVFQLRRDPAHLVGDARGVEGGPDHPGGDQQDQLGLLDLLLDGAEERAQDRNAVEEGNAGPVERALVLDQSAEDQRLSLRWIRPRLGQEVITQALDVMTGRTVTYSYDGSKRLTSVTDAASGVTAYWSALQSARQMSV